MAPGCIMNLICTKKTKVMESRARESKKLMMGTACASGSSGAPTSESITDVSYHSPLSFTSLLSLHPTTQNSFILFSPPPFSLSMSLPSLYSPSPSISAQPLPCLYAVKRADCVFEELVLSLKFLSHFPHFIFSLTVKFGCQTSPGGQPHNSHILYSAVTRSECIVEL